MSVQKVLYIACDTYGCDVRYGGDPIQGRYGSLLGLIRRDAGNQGWKSRGLQSVKDYCPEHAREQP